jgi:NAD(P)-dependent dehydrogenase (short-subunit alcohol dehydrogenase family)
MDFIRKQLDGIIGYAQKNPRMMGLAAAGAVVGLAGFAALSSSCRKEWDVQDKVAVITGASSGIGKALALHLVRLGARVSLAARRKEELNAVVEECNKIRKDSAIGTVTDVSIRGDNKALIDATLAHFGVIDILVLNAGISAGAPLLEVNEQGLDSFETIQKTNYFGPAYAAKYALPHLVKSIGKVVVISSVCGVHAAPSRSFYCGSKYALHGFFESLRMEMEMEKTGVTVTIICPGPVATDIQNTRVGPDGKKATTSHFDQKQAIPAETAAHYITTAFRRSERLRTFSLGTYLVHLFGNIVPSFWDILFLRGMRKLGMLEDSKKTH